MPQGLLPLVKSITAYLHNNNEKLKEIIYILFIIFLFILGSMSNNIDLNHMEPTEYFWLCAIVHDHIVKSEVARNFKLLLAQQPVKTKTVLLHLKYPVSVIALQYKVYDMDNPTNYEILHILQDPADSIAVFVGKDDKSGWILLNNYFRIPSLLSV